MKECLTHIIFNMKKILVILLLSLCVITSRAQSTVLEIQWGQSGVTYTGLLLLYPNDTGCFKVKYFYGSWVWCYQDARVSYSRDIYGNVTTYINCYNPKCAMPYAADNFVIYPNGNMYTQDAAGNWSTLIQAVIVDPMYWAMKKNEYGLR